MNNHDNWIGGIKRYYAKNYVFLCFFYHTDIGYLVRLTQAILDKYCSPNLSLVGEKTYYDTLGPTVKIP